VESYIKKACSLYPKGLDFNSDPEKYMESLEFKELLEHIDFHKKSDLLPPEKCLWDELSKYNEIIDNTSFEWWDRAYNWQILLSSTENIGLVTNFILCLNLSVVSNLFTIYVLRTDFDKKGEKLKNLPKRDTKKENKYSENLRNIRKLIQSKTKRRYVEIDNAGSILPDISFMDVPLGKFNLFNAFFLNGFYTKVW